jgi:hypothetical protein
VSSGELRASLAERGERRLQAYDAARVAERMRAVVEAL